MVVTAWSSNTGSGEIPAWRRWPSSMFFSRIRNDHYFSSLNSQSYFTLNLCFFRIKYYFVPDQTGDGKLHLLHETVHRMGCCTSCFHISHSRLMIFPGPCFGRLLTFVLGPLILHLRFLPFSSMGPVMSLAGGPFHGLGQCLSSCLPSCQGCDLTALISRSPNHPLWTECIPGVSGPAYLHQFSRAGASKLWHTGQIQNTKNVYF